MIELYFEFRGVSSKSRMLGLITKRLDIFTFHMVFYGIEVYSSGEEY